MLVVLDKMVVASANIQNISDVFCDADTSECNLEFITKKKKDKNIIEGTAFVPCLTKY